MLRRTAGGWILLALVLAGGRPARAEVVTASEAGFHLSIELELEATPERVYEALTAEIDQWWSDAHTYSGDASNLYLEPMAKGWFGERLPDGGIVCHLEVVQVQPGRLLRMTGGLGPLQAEGVAGSLTIEISSVDDTTRLSVHYRVGGFVSGGLEPWAEPVDGVLTEQFTRLRSHVESM